MAYVLSAYYVLRQALDVNRCLWASVSLDIKCDFKKLHLLHGGSVMFKLVNMHIMLETQ